MRSVTRFAAAHPLLFVILGTVAWTMAAGTAAFLAAQALQLPLAHGLPLSPGTLTAASLRVMMGRSGSTRFSSC
jgi:hypothetical protein